MDETNPFNTTENKTVFANETTTMTSEFPEAVAAYKLWLYVGILIIIIGTIGHILSLAVLCSSKSMRTQSSTIYLIAMSITGLVSLYTGLLRYVIHVGYYEWESEDVIRDSHDVICRLHMAVTYGSLQYFAWLQATVAVDRLVSVVLPHKYMTSCKWKVGLIIVIVEFASVVSLNAAVVIKSGHNNSGECSFLDPLFAKDIWGYIDLVSYSILPAIIMIVCNSIILYLLNKSKMKTGSSNSIARSLTVMLMSLNVLFLVTTLPISVMFFIEWGDYGTRRFAIHDLLWTIFSLLQYAGSACTFFLYCVTGSKFREELSQLICIRILKRKTKTRRSSLKDTMITSARPSPSNYRSLKVSIATDTNETSVEI